MRRVAMLGLVMLLTGAIAGCTNDSTAPSGSVVGVYDLRTINGSPLPFTFPSGTTITADQVTLNADGTYTDVSQYTNMANRVETGFYTATNGAITFDDRTDGIVYQGSVSGNVLTEIDPAGFTLVYQKE